MYTQDVLRLHFTFIHLADVSQIFQVYGLGIVYGINVVQNCIKPT